MMTRSLVAMDTDIIRIKKKVVGVVLDDRIINNPANHEQTHYSILLPF